MMKFVITGPESTGKTSLLEALSEWDEVTAVEEFARVYFIDHDWPPQYDDILKIAKGQDQLFKGADTPGQVVISDTWLIVMQVWSEDKFNKVHPWITEQIQIETDIAFLLCKPDIPWQADPMRTDPNRGAELFDRYKGLLDRYQVPFTIIQGSRAERLKQALDFINENSTGSQLSIK